MLTLAFGVAVLVAVQDTTPWTAYVGNQTSPAPWARTVRGPSQLPRFSFDSVYHAVARLPAGVSASINIGGPGHAAPAQVAAFFAAVERDQAAGWKDSVRARARLGWQAHRADESLTWQIANEINSEGWTRGILEWRAAGRRAVPNDTAVIPVYAEYLLAPAVEALRGWADAEGIDASRLRIMLGSIANTANPASRQWLLSLLSYRLTGTFAPSLRGFTVADVVDLVSIHYLMTVAGPAWAETIDALWGRIVGQGRVRGIWATEELGASRAEEGLGAAASMRVTARWLSWISSRYLSPDQARFSLWGSQGGAQGTRGTDGMDLLLRALGERPVWTTSLSAPPGQERYLLEATGSYNRVLIVFASTERSRVVVSDVDVPRGANRGGVGRLIEAGRITPVPVTVTDDGVTARIVLQRPIELVNQAVLLIELE